MIFLTYNDPPTGVYSSQVIDVCEYLNKQLNANIRLVAFVSIRGFFKSRNKIKNKLPNAIVLPMFPKNKNWSKNIYLLRFVCLILSEKKIIARGPFATTVALTLRDKGLLEKVCYDGRGAYTAELEEYNVDPSVKNEIRNIEKGAVLESDFRIAVSEALVKYWNKMFGYSDNRHVVIPCTINSKIRSTLPANEKIQILRQRNGFSEPDIVLVYSGSAAGWQSFDLLDDFLNRQMAENSNIKVVFLSQNDLSQLKIYRKFSNRISQKWLQHDEVKEFLTCCDYGILIRERTMTNKVASPTKFAEYLLSGLPVLISEQIGDFTDFVSEKKCGQVISEKYTINLQRINYNEKLRCNNLAISTFSKNNYLQDYKKIL